MKCEYLESADGTVRVTAVFESRKDMEDFKKVFDQFAALLPEKPETRDADQSNGDL